MDACTIVARRELARARVLAGSYRAHHPQDAFTVLVLDGVAGADTVDGAAVIALEDLVGPGELGMLAAGNPLAALPVAVLPRLLDRLHGEGAGPLLYLAAGLRVLGPLNELERLAGEHELVLVSRALGETRDGVAFSEREGGGAISHRVLASSGGPSARRVLEAWPTYFADEDRAVHDWFDGIPAVGEDVAVLPDPGYGLDPWTLSAARATNGAGELRVDGRPARLIDFSALDPEAPDRLNGAPKRARLDAIPALVQLRRRHAGELLAAGYAHDAGRHWRYAALRDGTPLTELMRALFLEGVKEGRLSESPFTQTGQQALYAYLNEPAERGSAAGITRLHYEIWKLRPDVQAAFAHLDGPDGPRFAAWLCEHALEDHHVPRALLPAGTGSPADAGTASQAAAAGSQAGAHSSEIDVREPPWGVNVAGFFTSELGLGEAARLLICGLDARDVPVLPVQARLVPPCGQGAEFAYGAPQDAPYPINVVCLNGDLIAPFAREVGESFFRDRHTIGLFFWEAGPIPTDWAAAFEHLDEVWVASATVGEAVAPVSPVPVVEMPMPVALPRVPQRTRAELGMPEEGFLFLYVHDYHSTAARKNPTGLVQAFKRAFAPGSGAKLVIKSINAHNLPHEHDRVIVAADGHPDIALIDAYVSAGEKNAMIAACDCYVSLHRSEGFGLTIAEAMLLGKPAIATRYGGNLEFMTDENSFLVDWTPVAVGEDAHPYPSDATWADPDLEQAAALMREVFDDPDRAGERAQQGRRDVLERHAPAVAGERMEARLRLIYDRLVNQGVRALNLAYRPAPAHPELGDLIAGEPAIGGAGWRSSARRLAQRAMRRLMRHFLSRQRAINVGLHEDIVRLDERIYEVVRELQNGQEARFAQTLAMVRRLRADVRDAQVAIEAQDRLDVSSRLQGLERLDLRARLTALEGLGRELEHHLAQHRAQPYVSEEQAFAEWREPGVGSVMGYSSNQPRSDQDRYLDFEATFRGPEERVREIQRAYLPLLAGQAPVLDVGCGRGELLDLLAEAKIVASGVDLDAGMVEHARAKGHQVALADGTEHLRSLEDGSLGAVVAIEVVEHMPYEALIEFLQLAHSRLRSDGVLLLETVNPHAVDAMKAFWVDPTHQRPLFPEVVLELCRLAGFGQAYCFHPLGAGDLEADRDLQPIYAVVARRASGGAPPGLRISSHS